MRSVVALYVANAREFTRDRLASVITLLMPIVFAIFFGVIFGGTSSFKLDLGLVVEDAGPAGQQLATAFTSEEAKKMLNVSTGSRDEMMAALNKGNLDIVMVLPARLTESIGTQRPTEVEVFYDQARQTSAGAGLGMVNSLLSQADLHIRGVQPLLVPQVKPIQTTPLRAVDYYVPSLLAMAMLWLGLFATLLPLVEQRERQVLRRLSASPVSRLSLLVGQVAWRLTVGLAQAAIFVLVGTFLLGVRIQGDWLLFAAMSVLGALVFVSMGYCLAGLSRTTEGAVAVAQLVNFPMMFLSGLFFQAQVLPDFLRPVMHLLPPTYLGDAFRQIMVGFSPLYPLWVDFAVLAAFLALFVGLGLRFFKWEQA